MKTLELSAKLFERYESTQRVHHYYGLLALFALAQTAYEANDKPMMEKCIDMLSMYPDKIEHPRYNFDNYKVGGAGKAWLLYNGFFSEEKELIREYAEKTILAPKSREGIFCWPADKEKNKIWIDTVYAVTPYMLYSGLALDEERYVDCAVEQCYHMYEFFVDKTCGLMHQSRGFMMDRIRVSADHWSRGNGWMYLGLTELVSALPANSEYRPKAEQYFKELSKALLDCCEPNGVWRQELTCEYSWVESSGTALFLYGFGVGLRLGILEPELYMEPFKKGIYTLTHDFITEDFSTLMSCQGCLCPGEGVERGSVKSYMTKVWPKTNEPHSYGAFMLALVEAHRNGIGEIDI